VTDRNLTRREFVRGAATGPGSGATAGCPDRASATVPVGQLRQQPAVLTALRRS